MKIKLLILVFGLVFAFSFAQPIFANPQVGDTKVTGPKGGPLYDVTTDAGNPIELQAQLYIYEEYTDLDGNHPLDWYPVYLRYLDFYVYKCNADGTNGDLVWSDSAITNYFTYNANPDKFVLTQKGCYNLVVKYDGNLNHSYTTAKINIV